MVCLCRWEGCRWKSCPGSWHGHMSGPQISRQGSKDSFLNEWCVFHAERELFSPPSNVYLYRGFIPNPHFLGLKICLHSTEWLETPGRQISGRVKTICREAETSVPPTLYECLTSGISCNRSLSLTKHWKNFGCNSSSCLKCFIGQYFPPQKKTPKFPT